MVRTPPSSTRPDTLSPSTKLNLTRPLAVTSPKRSTALPDVPTLTEQGITGADVTTWYGLLTTGGTPPAIVTRLNKELNATLHLPRSEEHTSELQSLMRITHADFCWPKKKPENTRTQIAR